MWWLNKRIIYVNCDTYIITWCSRENQWSIWMNRQHSCSVLKDIKLTSPKWELKMAFISVRFQVFFCLFLQLYIQFHETPFYTTNNCLHFYPRAFVLLPSTEMFFSLLNTALCMSICPLSIWVKSFLGEKSPDYSL